MKKIFQRIQALFAEGEKGTEQRRQNIASEEGGEPEPLRKENFGGAQSGFTLIELLACLGIFAVVTGVVLYNYAQFNSNILITNYAYDVALTIRQAQIYGVAVKGRTTSAGTTFGSSYGVHFDSSPANSFVYYADLPTDTNKNYYDKDIHGVPPAGTDESLELHSLPGSYVFSNFCVTTGPATQSCKTGTTPAITSLDISFKRPEPDALIKTAPGATVYNEATICIKSPLGKTRQVVIEQTGQISVVTPTNDLTCQ